MGYRKWLAGTSVSVFLLAQAKLPSNTLNFEWFNVTLPEWNLWVLLGIAHVFCFGMSFTNGMEFRSPMTFINPTSGVNRANQFRLFVETTGLMIFALAALVLVVHQIDATSPSGGQDTQEMRIPRQ